MIYFGGKTITSIKNILPRIVAPAVGAGVLILAPVFVESAQAQTGNARKSAAKKTTSQADKPIPSNTPVSKTNNDQKKSIVPVYDFRNKSEQAGRVAAGSASMRGAHVIVLLQSRNQSIIDEVIEATTEIKNESAYFKKMKIGLIIGGYDSPESADRIITVMGGTIFKDHAFSAKTLDLKKMLRDEIRTSYEAGYGPGGSQINKVPLTSEPKKP